MVPHGRSELIADENEAGAHHMYPADLLDVAFVSVGDPVRQCSYTRDHPRPCE